MSIIEISCFVWCGVSDFALLDNLNMISPGVCFLNQRALSTTTKSWKARICHEFCLLYEKKIDANAVKLLFLAILIEA